jgi:DNA modification methylase
MVGQAAMFPVALPEFFIKAFSDNGDAWLDPFLGSGTTIVAAHRNGRRGLGIEALPKYVSVVNERIQSMGLDVKRVT